MHDQDGRLVLSQRTYSSILHELSCHFPECGGILGAGESGIVTEFYFDKTGRSSPDGYAPDVAAINRMLTEDWMPRGILMVGIVHSHANGNDVPSCMDVGYGMRILQALDTVDSFYLPIVTGSGEDVQMTCYAIMPGADEQMVCRKINLHVIGGDVP